ncbi:MAG: ArsC family transcriptional regulator [Ignavibacterium sp.]|nr:ArsC family transcriptional regulator [Ignavibacterium sp.]MCX7610987.1 ArsC family transcriptional regulator [Ignavibacterium sp.]MDW8374261.1 ArsC family transcriptional regulator [Ignavibacteriales bacterium]
MEVQIIGTRKCKETQKAERFFKERRIKVHFRDLNEKGLTKGELENISQKISLEDLLNVESKIYKQKGMMYMKFDIAEELLNEPLLIKTPIVRFNKFVTVGYQPEVWKTWIELNK